MYTVVDPQRLAHEVQTAVDEQYGGSQSAAAQDIGIPQAQVSRLINAKPGAVGLRTVRAIGRLVGEARWQELYGSLLSPTSRALLQAYHAWHDTFFAVPERGKGGARWHWSKRGPVNITAREDASYRESAAAREAFTTGSWRDFERMILLTSLIDRFPGEFKKFEAFAVERGHLIPAFSGSLRSTLFRFGMSFAGDEVQHVIPWDETRVIVAVWRTIEPLLAARETGFIERTWEEMTDAQLRRFVRAGLEREMILLDRSPDVQRAQEFSGHEKPEVTPLRPWELYADALAKRLGDDVMKACDYDL